MKLIRCLLPALLLGLACVPAGADLLIGSPDLAPSFVSPDGALLEDWGKVRLVLQEPAGAALAGQQYRDEAGPTAVTTWTAGPVTLTQTAYRAPIWPAGVDVLTAALANSSDQPVTARLQVVLPEQAGCGELSATLGGRTVLAWDEQVQPIRRERAWGCTGGVVAMPGWARPEGECDPAFRNIAAGMGGVPIVYRFQVPPGAARTVMLGLCESHWGQAGGRPLSLQVEGTPARTFDPLAAWGQHRPGVVRFDAVDANGDGRLQVAVYPGPRAPDRNPILNVIWIFPPDQAPDPAQVLSGRHSQQAEYYVDVGGERDQLLYDSGELAIPVSLPPHGSRELTFLVACPGASAPAPGASPWSPPALRRAAADVWQGVLESAGAVRLPQPLLGRWRLALARLLAGRPHVDGFCVALGEGGALDRPAQTPAAQVIAALDLAGCPQEAERMLRLYWDQPLPPPLAAWAPEGGRYPDAGGDPCAQGLALQALARHALLTGDLPWAKLAWPALRAGAAWLAGAGRESLASPQARLAAATGLAGSARVAGMLGLPEAQALGRQAQALDPQAAWSGTLTGELAEPVAEVVGIRNALVREGAGELALLPGVDEQWLDQAGLAARLPTEYGRLSLWARREGRTVWVSVQLAPRPGLRGMTLALPTLGGARPTGAEVDEKRVAVSGPSLRLSPGSHRVMVSYP